MWKMKGCEKFGRPFSLAEKDSNQTNRSWCKRHTSRMEMGYCLYGWQSRYAVPIEAAVGWDHKFTKDFTNSEANKPKEAERVSVTWLGFVCRCEDSIRRVITPYCFWCCWRLMIGRSHFRTQCQVWVGIGMDMWKLNLAKTETAIFIQVRTKTWRPGRKFPLKSMKSSVKFMSHSRIYYPSMEESYDLKKQ